MKNIFFFFLCLPFLTKAQENGIHFKNDLTWSQIQAKAKAEDKYIFVDCYGSWCGPCKAMDRDVYCRDTVGKEFNKNFVSFKIQLDKTAKDSGWVKNHYADAELIDKQFAVKVFPTFLFFSPDGELVHRDVGYQSVQQFLQISKDARDPKSQYYTLLKHYQEAQKIPDEMYKLALEAKSLDEDSIATAVSKDEINYLFSKSNIELLTENNIRFIASFAASTKDKGFALFNKQANSVDSVMKSKSYSRDIVDKILINEDIDPLRQNGNADWKQINKALTEKYDATIADRAITKAKIYSCYGKDWQEFTAALVHYTDEYEDKANLKLLDKNARYVLQHSQSKREMQSALTWNELTLAEQPGNKDFIATNAALKTKLATIN